MNIPTPNELRQVMASDGAARLSPDAKVRLEWIAHYVMNHATVSETCARFDIARGTFVRWLERFDPRDLSTLEEQPRDIAPRNSAVPEKAVVLIRALRQKEPLMGKDRISEILQLEYGIELSSSTVGRVIERECLYFGDTPLHWRKRMQHNPESVATPERDSSTVPTTDLPRDASAECADQTVFCACGWCRFKRKQWPLIRRSIVISSILINVVFIGLLLFSALREGVVHAARAANLHETTTSSLDLLTDGR